MRFRRIHVEGFGVWDDLEVADLSPGLNVFVAPNEGGKSTLMAFVRAVLFGFKRRGDQQRYEPLHGGRHGGSLDVEADGTAYRISRLEGSPSKGEVEVVELGGRRFGEGKLESLLRNTTETLYENVFAFGLEELQRIDTLQADDVAGHIYSAGMGSGKLSPVEFRARMQAGMDELYLARGKKQPVTRLLAEIERQEERIEQLRQSPERHAELLRQYRRLQERLAEHDATLEKRHTELDRALRAQRGWEHYETLLEAESTLETIGIEPAQLHERLRTSTRTERVRAEAARSPANRGETGSAGGRGSVETAVQEVTTADPVELMSRTQRTLLHQANKIRGLMASARRLRELREEVEGKQQTARQLRHTLFNDLEELGDRWSLERVRAARTDVKARDEIRQWRETIDKAAQDIEAAKARAADANLLYEAMRESREQIGRGALLVSWGLILLAIVATAILVPTPARLTATVSIVAVGLMLGAFVSWLHVKGLRQRRSEQSLAARREADLWQHHDDAKEAHTQTLQEFHAWLEEQNLPRDLSTQGALDLIDRLRQTQEKDHEATAAEASVTRTTAELQRVCMDVLAVLEEIDRQSLDLRYDAVKMVDPLLSTIEGLQAELSDVEEHRERVRRVLDDHASARAALRALAGEEGLDVFRRRLESADPDRLARRVGDAQGRLEAARADRDALNENLGGLREQIRGLETDAELSDLIQAREARRTALLDAVENWTAHALTVALYDEAKRKYEAERQPEVLRLASRYFQRMTDGRYSRVIAPLGENRLEVERAHSGERLETPALSRGTGEQLYLSMRLALAEVYGAQATPIPLVADDILVNFDDDRARATAALLDLYASEGHQILAFTCHRHLVGTFERHAPNAAIRTLPAHS